MPPPAFYLPRAPLGSQASSDYGSAGTRSAARSTSGRYAAVSTINIPGMPPINIQGNFLSRPISRSLRATASASWGITSDWMVSPGCR